MTLYLRTYCLQKQLSHRIFRSFAMTSTCLQEKRPDISSESQKNSFKNPSYATHRPNAMEKYFLIWTGRYEKFEHIPPFINQEVMERVRNIMRIRIASVMMVCTALGCVIMIFSGKRAAERGITVTKQNLEWHKLYNEESQNEKK